MSSAIEVAKHTLLSGGLILAIGTVTGFVARKIKVPDIALFLVVGIAIGPTVMGLIDIKADFRPLSDHSSIRGELHPL